MSVRAIVRPASLGPSFAGGLLGSGNLLSSEPKAVAVSNGQTPDANFVVPNNAPIEVDTFVLAFVGASGVNLDALSVNFGLRSGGGNITVGRTALLPSRISGGRRHAVLQLAQPLQSTLFGFNVTTDDGPPPAGISFGLFAVGRAFRPTWGGEWGGGVGLVDTARVRTH